MLADGRLEPNHRESLRIEMHLWKGSYKIR